MKLHNRVTQMEKSSHNLKICKALTVLALGLASAGVQALPALGTETDTTCLAFNGTKPYSTGNTTTPRTNNGCGMCHTTANLSIYLTPEWDWSRAGLGSVGEQNFCVVQGIIATPTGDVTVSQSGMVNLSARGFSPLGGKTVYPLTYTWTFSDGRTALVGATQNNVPFNTAGDVTVTLTAVDATNNLIDPIHSDTTTGAAYPETQRIIHVSNAPTVGVNDSYTVQAGKTLNVSAPGVMTNDTGTAPLKAVLGTSVAHGSLSLSNTGAFSYTPLASYSGSDSFTYTATNGVLTSQPTTVTINVASVAPTANADYYSVQPGITPSVVAQGVLSNDLGSGTVTAVLGTNVTKGSLSLNSDGSFSYTPNTGFTGNDSFTYLAHNSSGNSTPATVTLAVGACTDKDKDGYSPEGGSCGPVDCNDKQMTMNPGLKEICTNKIDDDCNGKVDQADPACSGADCIGAKLGNLVKIDSANWSSDKLAVTGSKAAVGATVTVSKLDPVTLAATTLGTTTVIYNGTWKLEQAIVGSANAPCRIKVVINAATGIRAVTGSTANCSSQNGAPASCGP
ncbi:MAG: Ig-like domain-containing protein [Proteobacteria bacterium]|nr:Ig-like domain-containing protein [Pseudomonadota bacterium]